MDRLTVTRLILMGILFLPVVHLADSPQNFLAVDTSRLMGSPTTVPPLEVEIAFPNLKFQAPVQIDHAGDGTDRLFVVTQEGRIFVFPNQPDTKEAVEFLDLRERVHPPRGDNGMFCLAFHPRFANNGRFFVIYMGSDRPKNTYVSEFKVSTENPNQADPKSEKVLLRLEQPYPDHNAACLRFGPDGYLYISLGDGGYQLTNENAQDRSNLFGSMLRIDIDRTEGELPYGIPPNNPFVHMQNVRGEIWAYGLRAPWRFSFDRLTGDCWLGDNGQVAFEEIDLIRKGENYGWMPREGRHAFDPSGVDPRGRPILKPGENLTDLESPTPERLTDPVVEYDHTQGKSVVGGLVYRGSRIPELYGSYLYGDYAVGNVWVFRWDGNEVHEHRLVAKPRIKITSFGEDGSGNMYFTAFDGKVHRLRRTAEMEPDQKPFPTKLSDTGLFTQLHPLTPVPGLIPYSVNVPLWSDGAGKERYLALPSSGKVVFQKEGAWEFPIGTVFVKGFELGPAGGNSQRLETRLLVRNQRGWDGYTYLWNDEGTEAFLLDGAHSRTFDVADDHGVKAQEWYFPSRSDCFACHTTEAGVVLGVNTKQINRLGEKGVNQLERLSKLGIFSTDLPGSPTDLPAFPDWLAQAADTNELARAYLDANCAMCHQPPGFTGIDFRYRTPLEETNLVNFEPEKARIGPDSSKLLRPGDPGLSELYLRMALRGPGQMPNLATSLTDDTAAHVIREWIESLPQRQ